MRASYSSNAVREHVLQKLPITQHEASVLYGHTDLRSIIYAMRKLGYEFDRVRIQHSVVKKRLKRFVNFDKTSIPDDILCTQYRLLRRAKQNGQEAVQ
jgi:hypothetical protein